MSGATHEQPHIAELPARDIAVIPVQCTRAEMPNAMARGVAELLDAVRAQGAQPAGPVFTHHLRHPTDTFDFEIGVPVDRPIGPLGRVQSSEWPAMRVARAVHRGRYEDLPQAWGAFMAWIGRQGLQPTGDLWECYLAGPETGLDTSAWRTELNQPLRDA